MRSELRLPRAVRRRLVRVARALLCALLVLGLTPGLDELVETVAHLAHDGHLPHSATHAEQAGDETCGDADEHGCTPLSHHCGCCTSVPALPPRVTAPDAPGWAEAPRWIRASTERGPPIVGVEPGLRPPIA